MKKRASERALANFFSFGVYNSSVSDQIVGNAVVEYGAFVKWYLRIERNRRKGEKSGGLV